MRKAISFLFLLSLVPFMHGAATASPTPARLAPRTDETQIWDLEKAYWEYVKANELEKYRALWHESFLGWPYSSSSPARKDHITDWIVMHGFLTLECVAAFTLPGARRPKMFTRCGLSLRDGPRAKRRIRQQALATASASTIIARR